MRNLLLMASVLASFLAPIFGSENSENKIVIFADLSAHQTLQLPPEQYNDLWKGSSPDAKYNSPCFACYQYRSEDIVRPVNKQGHNQLLSYVDFFSNMESSWQEKPSLEISNSVKKEIKNDQTMVKLNNILDGLNASYKFIPLNYFINADNGYKSKGEELFSFDNEVEGKKFHFVIKLDTVLSYRIPENDINEFEQIIKAEESALFYSRLKKFFCGGLITIIALYALYKKLNLKLS